MKSLTVIFTVTCFAACGFAGDKSPLPPATPIPQGAREIGIAETEALIHDQKDIAILDVRTPDEFQKQGHLPGAKHLDFFREDFDKLVLTIGIDLKKPCIVYCAIGGRAKRAADKMAKLGFREILIPKGCFNAWRAAGKVVEK